MAKFISVLLLVPMLASFNCASTMRLRRASSNMSAVTGATTTVAKANPLPEIPAQISVTSTEVPSEDAYNVGENVDIEPEDARMGQDAKEPNNMIGTDFNDNQQDNATGDSSEENWIGDDSFFPDRFPEHGTYDDDNDSGPPFQGGLFFDTPFFGLDQIQNYFLHMERAMERILRDAMLELGRDSNSFRNSSDKVVDIDGHKFQVHTSLISGGDGNNSVSIKAISAVPLNRRRKRSPTSL